MQGEGHKEAWECGSNVKQDTIHFHVVLYIFRKKTILNNINRDKGMVKAH